MPTHWTVADPIGLTNTRSLATLISDGRHGVKLRLVDQLDLGTDAVVVVRQQWFMLLAKLTHFRTPDR